MLEYYAKHPPAHLVLGTVHLKGQSDSSWKPITEQEAMGQIRQLSGELNIGTTKLPPHLRDMAHWAKEQTAKMTVQ